MIALSEARQVEKADVYKGLVLAGQLHRLADRTEFTYLPSYVESGAIPIATTLPLREAPYLAQAGAVPPFFAGLLPEGRRLSALRARVRTSVDDEFSLLVAIGTDTVGDVRICLAGAAIDEIEPLVRVEKSWSEVDFGDLFRRSTGSDPDRAGIPGVQEKVSGRMILFPLARRRGQYLLKLNPPEFPHVVENEAFFLAAAASSGLPTPRFEVVTDCNGEHGLLVYRFDRAAGPEKTEISLGFEDGCQVLGRYPADKYRLETEAVAGGLSAVTAARPVARLAIFQLVMFACITGNGDLHARNLAVLRGTNGEWRVAPAFDLPCTSVYGDHSMALSIGGKIREVVSRKQALKLAGDIELARPAAERALDRLLASAPGWMDRLGDLPFDARRCRDLRRFLESRQRQLRA